MDLVRHLRYFEAVAEELHFGNAAIRLGMAQPPLSQRIQRLERELGVRLFDRTSRQVRLTDAGRALLAEAREILGRVDHLHAVMERARRGEVGTLRAAVTPDLAAPVVAALIAAAPPGVRLALSQIGTVEQVAALTAGELDVGVLHHPVTAPGLAFGPMLAQPVGVLLEEGDPLAASASVHLADLSGRDLVLFPRATAPGLYDEMIAGCRRHGFDPPAVHETPNPQFALGLVLAGTAVSLTPEAPSPGAVWRPLTGEPLHWRASTAWPRDTALAQTGEFAARITAILAREAGMRPVDALPARRVAPRPSSGFLA
ncbi:LysR substrate-binding domain-containing protein [Bailinhaonella thermotolerans]|uniref:LysR family transcriptional regulator n=1 Tax=Bailinhaonella thermotolerans TaxID=1070861 RepID=A0A3A4B8K9_9ACTN|nr:LysR substrate-binding domain-containing protein [Bailinhaonella thermotolerans]RJL34561.1 LysR family transcriptional regulator [Bailinhaonella thermotolerans]